MLDYAGTLLGVYGFEILWYCDFVRYLLHKCEEIWAQQFPFFIVDRIRFELMSVVVAKLESACDDIQILLTCILYEV